MPAILRQHVRYEPRSAPPSPVVKASRKGMIFRPWTEDEIASLKKLCVAEHSYETIGKMIGRSMGSVYKKINELGLNKPLSYANCGIRKPK